MLLRIACHVLGKTVLCHFQGDCWALGIFDKAKIIARVGLGENLHVCDAKLAGSTEEVF